MPEASVECPNPADSHASENRAPCTRSRYKVAVLPSLLLIGLWLLLTLPKLLQHAAGETADLDTGNYHHLAWAIANGLGFGSSVLARHHLAEHFSPVMVLVAALYRLWPSAYVLMLLQASAIWGTVALVLGQMYREVSGVDRPPMKWLGVMCLLVMLLLYPPLSMTWATQFQPIELGMPLVVLAMLAIHYERTRWLWLVIPLLLSTRESAPLSVAGIAIYAWAGYGRWRLAAVLVGVAAAWALVSLGVVMPHFREGRRWGHLGYLGWTAAWDEKGEYLAVMLLGLGFLPFIGSRALAATLGVVPGLLLNVSVDRWTQYGFAAHYDAQTAPFIMLGAAFGIGSFTTWAAAGASVSVFRRRWGTALVACVIMAVLAWEIPDTPTLAHRTVEWWPEPGVTQTLAEARELARRYRSAPGMTAHHRIGPHIAARPGYLADRSGKDKSGWALFAATRLRPGHIFIVPKADVLAPSRLRGHLRASGAAELVETGRFVEVWRWPDDAPQPNTPEARTWATERYREQASRYPR